MAARREPSSFRRRDQVSKSCREGALAERLLGRASANGHDPPSARPVPQQRPASWTADEVDATLDACDPLAASADEARDLRATRLDPDEMSQTPAGDPRAASRSFVLSQIRLRHAKCRRLRDRQPLFDQRREISVEGLEERSEIVQPALALFSSASARRHGCLQIHRELFHGGRHARNLAREARFGRAKSLRATATRRVRMLVFNPARSP